MRKKIVITGATGLIGKNIASKLIALGNKVIILTRLASKAKRTIPGAADYVIWNNNNIDNLKSSLDGADGIIHLAGENVMAKRWDEKHKKNIYNSRINTTQNLVDIIKQLNHKPEAFICASAIGFYGSNNLQVDEYSPQGDDFLANVVGDWEKESRKVEEAGVRNVNIRTGIVLDKNEGALAKMLLPFKLFIGGPLGSGKQWFPWIHIDDITELFLFALNNKDVSGVINGVSPQSITMNEFATKLGKVLNRPSIFRVPEFVLRIALGEGASSIITGTNVIPKRTIDYGFKYMFDDINNALNNLLH